jgi:signal transduction histidine kinase
MRSDPITSSTVTAAPDVLADADPERQDEWRAAYRAEQDRLIAQRIPITVGIYLLMIALAIGIEMTFPERRWIAMACYGAHVVVSLVWLAVIRIRWPRRLPIGVAAVGLACSWCLVMTAYGVVVVRNPERIGSGLICLLYGLFFMVPWRWKHQLAVSIVALLGIAATSSLAPNPELLAYGMLVVFTGAVTSVGGVIYLDRYRFDGFVRTAQLTAASQEKEQEAEIAAALLTVSEALSQYVNEPDLLAHLTRIAVEAVGCDWGSTFALDERHGLYRMAGVFGEPLGVREEIEIAEFDDRNLPLIRVLEPGALIELEDARTQTLVPPALLERWGVASQLIAPITLSGRVVGALCLAYGERRGPFSIRERRLARGIVHATALALANSSLISDLRSANKLRSEFVSTMSHELRTPLNVILGFAEMTQEDDLDDAERRQFLHRIEEAGRDLLRLIEDTLAMGRIESGRDRAVLEPIDLGLLWERLHRECVVLPQKSAVAFEWQPIPAPATLVTDPRKLTIVMRNLVHNALKFTEAGWVRAQVATEDGQLVLTVSDTGIGIEPHDQRVVFEMFRQGDGSDTRRYGGTGLGLHIVQRYVEQLGGTIALASAPGVGSRFTVTLPLDRTLDESIPLVRTAANV